MNDINELFKQLPVSDIAKQLGVSKTEASSAIKSTLPALLTGLQANATDPAGASSLLSALQSKDGSLAEGAISLSNFDVGDGAKIVSNIFGGSQDNVAAKLGGGDKSDMMKSLMAILAPIVLTWVTSKVIGGDSGSSKKGGGLGDLLGGLFGGKSSNKKSGTDLGGGLADALGGLLGGGGSSDGFGLDDLLGGLLGGGKR